ncbi:MAG: hypothetical protein ACOYT4_03265 [Nanoarchaeota archaeon]
MEEKELIEKVKSYLTRCKADSLVENHSIEEHGYWRILTGTYGQMRKSMKEVLSGKFIDAVVYAVQQPEFYGDGWAGKDPGNINNGKIEKVNLHILDDSNLVKLIQNS